MKSTQPPRPDSRPRPRFGTSGIPRSSLRPATEDGIRRAAELGLTGLEMAWGNGVRMKPETADRIANVALETGLELTAHAPYFINLCGDRDTAARSVGRLIETGVLAARCGARSFCFHPGFLGGQKQHDACVRVWRALLEVTRGLRERGIAIDVRPELTGRASQMGAFDETLTWCELVRALKDRGVGGWVVCESPAVEDDAVHLQRTWEAA